MSLQRACTVTLLLLVLLPALLVDAQNVKRKRWTPEEFPNPQKDTKRCGRPGVPSSICDPELVLTTKELEMVDGLINQIAEGTEPFKAAACGAVGEQGFQVGTSLGRIHAAGSTTGAMHACRPAACLRHMQLLTLACG